MIARRLSVPTFFMLSMLFAGCGGSGTTPSLQGAAPPANTNGAPSSSSVSSQDQSFLNYASQANISEIDAANVALKQSTTTSVRNFANRMISDHGTGQHEVETLAASLGVTVPTTPLPEEAQKLASYQNLTGNAFDLAYAQDQVTAHMNTIAVFEQEISSGSNEQVIGFAKSVLPILQAHLQLAQQLVASCGGATPTPSH